jgi:hypothetical protein
VSPANLAIKGEPSSEIRKIYASLPQMKAEVPEAIEGRNCLHFSGTERGVHVDIWVDEKTQFIRRSRMQSQGATQTQVEYEALAPLAESARAFDVSNTSSIFQREFDGALQRK